MKKIVVILVATVLFVVGVLQQHACAQAPNKLSYQAVIRNSSNALVSSQPIGMRISILQGSASGASVYVETQTPTTNANGLVSIEIGGGTLVSGNFSTINWANGPYFVKTETDPSGGTNYTISGTSQLLSVPYALYAATAGNNTPGPQGPAGPTGATGPQGPAGANGTNGSNGINGTAVLNGTNNPTAGIGVDGDFYINTASNTLFGPKSGGTWPAGVSLIGATGPQGPIGLTGAIGPQGVQGPLGLTGATGPQGPAGTNGINGTAVLNGANNPTVSIGVDGDFYINTASNTLFGPKSGGVWPTGVSLIGAAGPQGPIGLTGATGSQGPIGLTGATGPQGATGALGPIGLTGATGATGPQGATGSQGPAGTNGVSIITTSVIGDSLFVTLSNGQTLNAGHVRGPQGIQGIAGSFPNGTAAGEMLYWNGTAWVSVVPTTSLPGNQAKTLKFCNGAPTWEDCPATLPTLTTSAINANTSSIASSGGDISNDGGAAVTVRGVCWSTSSNPTVALSTKTTDGSGTGSFTSSITGLVADTTYYVRAYATNSVGTAYGSEVVFTNALTIGQSYQGGILAYILQPGDPGYDANVPHGLIAAPSDQSTGIVWWDFSSSVTTGATGMYLGTGNANTNTIVAVQGNGNYAAKLCYDLVLNGYSDWYLPSWDELNKLHSNKGIIGGFAAWVYWSSSEGYGFESNYAYSQNFYNGYQSLDFKSNAFYVRAVRAF